MTSAGLVKTDAQCKQNSLLEYQLTAILIANMSGPKMQKKLYRIELICKPLMEMACI